MHYKELNKFQKGRMKQISAHEYTMEWENPEFMDYLTGAFPKIRKSQDSIGDESDLIGLKKMN